MLVGNRTVLDKSPGRFLSGTVASSERSNFSKPGMLAGRFEQMSKLAAVPNGHLAPSAWALPRTAGGMSAVNEGDFSFAAATLTLADGRNLSASTTFEIAAGTADLQLVVSATGTASITFTQSALLAGALSATGSAAFSIAPASVTLGAIVSATASAAFSLSTTATPRATGNLAGNITPFTDLSPEGLAASVWGEILESGYTAKDLMRLLSSVAAGKTDINTAGPDPIVTFRDLNDTANRVVATMSGSERASVTKNTA